jgi:AmmeMemoRadiSam system protein A/AmmeMemoRadiSam system protein B
MSILYTCCVPHPPLIIPEVGKGEEKKIQDTIHSYHEVMKKVASFHPETIIIISPHNISYSDYFNISEGAHAEGDFGQFRAKQVKVTCDYDEEFVDALCHHTENSGVPAGTLGQRTKRLDHATMIPLYFLNQYMTDYKVVRMGLSGLSYQDHYHLGQLIQKTADELNRKVVIIASGDLSHKLKESGPYGYAKEGPEFDQKVIEALSHGNFLDLMTMDYGFCERAAECGLRSFIIMAGALDCLSVQPTLYSYEGPFGVGYGVVGFDIGEKDPTRNFGEQAKRYEEEKILAIRKAEDPYVRWARNVVESYVMNKTVPALPPNLPESMLNNRAGVFVSIKKDGQLRGCIGTFQPTTDNIALEIRNNAISASTRDPRFSPITRIELPKLIYSVDILGEVTPATYEELDPQKYGIIVKHHEKRGLLLPRLDGVDTVSEQIEIAARKAGIYDDEDIELFKFEVVRHY